ncbi:KpsF/GutQ family sugar-phosphate isomerase [Halothiobacillus neapolitanus]|jgi:arabinose-5-phosphate isomerase|uniref:Arabinose 5-phosphate isomerase n=1 Tax=Halothiobacillus neapolitanus (strain ATCC 23641 / DSM 15147 / CIP 104769 / NCIMB 8539 / c2) TaxID=555778 RepID=D0KYT2_HALNC|nr:KpsF/GutQ family sugar-phosphate isomerase [Halothiobacillus neapolitanus]ACX95605.1 KpsF/GutQ family protein [Halothiobacillus neapolitanus c2]OZB75964.1 MAG: D-arabinose 5-phosphate isomerase [Halothiobacillus sp. 14-55-98]OZB84315.1 MAG: D-arabinose 5-phosphate isomerase [Halothiobacillus sp. 13-55-253]
MNPNNLLAMAKQVIDIEAQACQALSARLDHQFITACELMLKCDGRVIVIGMGKSGHIGGKIAATLASTGTPAFFVHPGEASHGDLGMITRRDVVLALSNSGETAEMLAILPVIKRLGTPLVALTGRPQSTLAKAAEAHLDVSVEREACPLNLAPTASTTAALVMGDALAVALLDARAFQPEDFALSHPGGTLGRRLLLRVQDVMHTGDRIPRVMHNQTIKQALIVISSGGLGMTTIVDEQQKLLGLFTDGDLRRILDQEEYDLNQPIERVMIRNPRTCTADKLAAEALAIMERDKINGLIVTDNQSHVIGALNMHDLLRAGVA